MLGRNDALRKVIDKGNVVKLKHLIDNLGFSYSKKWLGGYAPLYYALFVARQFECAQVLLELGARVKGNVRLLHTGINENVPFNLLAEIIRRDPNLVNEENSRNETPLLRAIKRNNPKCVQFLISKDAVLDDPVQRVNPLMCAIAKGSLIIVKILLDNGAEPKLRHFHYAIRCMKKDIVKFFLNTGFDVNATDRLGQTGLHLLCSSIYHTPPSETLQALKWMLKFGANPNIENHEKRTPLYYAIHSRQYLLVMALLKHNIDFNVEGNKAAAYQSTFFSECELLIYFMKYGYKCESESFLRVAVFSKQYKEMRALLRQGFDINSALEAGFTPLLTAVCYGHFELFKNLVDCGADVNATLSKGQGVIHFAAAMNKKFLEYVLQLNLKINQKMDQDVTALHWAARYANFKVVALLIAHGADVNAKMTNGYTPIHLSLKKETFHDGTVEILLNHGADVNAQDCFGRTPLHIAASRGLKDMIVTLLLRDPDLQIRDKWGKTAMEVAIQHTIAANLPQSRCIDVYQKNTKTMEESLRKLFVARRSWLDTCESYVYNGYDEPRDDFDGYKSEHETRFKMLEVIKKYMKLKKNRERILRMEKKELKALIRNDKSSVVDINLANEVLLMRNTEIFKGVTLFDIVTTVEKKEIAERFFASEMEPSTNYFGGVVYKFCKTIGLKNTRFFNCKIYYKTVLKDFRRAGYYPLLRKKIDAVWRFCLEENVCCALQDHGEIPLNRDTASLVVDHLTDLDLVNFLKATFCFQQEYGYETQK